MNNDINLEQVSGEIGISTTVNIIEIPCPDWEVNRKGVDRMKICLQCEHFLKITKQCKKCGCFMPIKVRIPGQKCPVEKW